MKKLDRRDIVYSLALAGISAALATIFVTLGVYVRFTTVAFFIAAGLSLMIPLAKRYLFAAFAAFAASGAASFFIAGSDVYAIAGYIIYFGPMALISGIMYNLHVKWYFQAVVKLVYINGALALLYFVMGNIVIDPSVMELMPYWAIAIVGSILLMAVDAVLVFIYSRLIPIVGKVLRASSKSRSAAPVPDDSYDEDPFEEEFAEQDIYPKQTSERSAPADDHADDHADNCEADAHEADHAAAHENNLEDDCKAVAHEADHAAAPAENAPEKDISKEDAPAENKPEKDKPE